MPDLDPEILTGNGSDTAALLDWINTQDRRTLHTLAPGKLYAVVGDNGRPIMFDTFDYGDRPAAAERSPVVLDVPSFVDYLNEWWDAETVPEVWADPAARTVTAVLNAGFDGGLGRGNHRVTLAPERTPDWAAWVRASGALMGQEEFAEFIEDHLPQIVDPSGAVMLEVAQSLQGTTKAEWKQARRLADGQVGLQYVETANATAGQKGQLAIPAEFALALEPFVGSGLYRIKARFRYRISGDTIRMGYKLDRSDDVLDAAWKDILGTLRDRMDESSLGIMIRVGRHHR